MPQLPLTPIGQIQERTWDTDSENGDSDPRPTPNRALRRNLVLLVLVELSLCTRPKPTHPDPVGKQKRVLPKVFASPPQRTELRKTSAPFLANELMCWSQRIPGLPHSDPDDLAGKEVLHRAKIDYYHSCPIYQILVCFP